MTRLDTGSVSILPKDVPSIGGKIVIPSNIISRSISIPTMQYKPFIAPDDIFAPDFDICGETTSDTIFEQMSAKYYMAISECIAQLFNSAYLSILYGRINMTELILNTINDFHNFFMYLMFIYLERQDDANNNPCLSDRGSKYYKDKYSIQCIRNYFTCLGCSNIDSALRIFGLGLDGDNFVLADGIGHMYIQDDSFEDNFLCVGTKRPFQIATYDEIDTGMSKLSRQIYKLYDVPENGIITTSNSTVRATQVAQALADMPALSLKKLF